MRTRPTLAALLALGSFAVCAFGVRPAAAESDPSCSQDSDCVKGWSCQVVGATGCASACAPGEKCDAPPECGTEQEIKACRPGPCTADRDCADGMVCSTSTSSADCPVSTCAPGANCPPSPACEPKTTSACVPRYTLPCTTASDCGAGFSCIPLEEDCACSGSSEGSGGGSDGKDGGAPTPPPPPEPDCTCTPSTTSRCFALPVTCTATADCANGWTCAVVGATADCASTPPSPAPEPGQDGGTPTPRDEQPCKPSTTVMQCVPPFYNEAGVAYDIGLDGSAENGSGSPTSGNGAEPPRAAGNDSASTSSAGCSFALGSASSSAGALLFAVGLLGMARRRRRTAPSR